MDEDADDDRDLLQSEATCPSRDILENRMEWEGDV